MDDSGNTLLDRPSMEDETTPFGSLKGVRTLLAAQSMPGEATKRLQGAQVEAVRSFSRFDLPPLDEAEAALVAARDGAASAKARLDEALAERAAAKAVAENASIVLRAAERDRQTKADARTIQLEQEERDFRAGFATTSADVPALDAEIAAADRRIVVLGGERAKTIEPLALAEGAVFKADDAHRSALAYLARAALMVEAARRIPSLVADLAPLLGAYQRAVASAGEEARQIGHREVRRAQFQMTSALVPILDELAVAALGERQRVAAPSMAERAPADGVTLVVRPGNNYGGARGGERVIVDESTAREQLRVREHTVKDKRVVVPLGALMTIEEFEQTQLAKAERERPRPIEGAVGEIKKTVEAALARLTGDAEAKRATSSTKREGLARLVEHLMSEGSGK